MRQLRIPVHQMGPAWVVNAGAVCVLMLAGCASGPAQAPHGAGRLVAPAAASDRDGPEAHPPANLAQVPDAEPRVETVRPGGANKPYQALGHDYVPLTGDPVFSERGLASWYGRKFQGRRTASGEPYDMYAMAAAHPTLPIPSYARIRNPANGREVVVRINDRGPFHSGRIVDLSYTAALKLDVLHGVAPVELERITYDEVRSGAWKRGGSAGEGRVADAKAGVNAKATADANANVKATAKATGANASTASVLSTPSAIATVLAPPMGSTLASTAASTLTPMPTPTPTPTPTSTPTSPQTPTINSTATSVATASSMSPTSAAARVEVIDTVGPPAHPSPGSAPSTAPTAGFYVQLGAFREREGAEVFQRRVLADADWLSPVLAVIGDSTLYRLQAGPYASRGEAARAADRMRADLQLVALVVERR